MDGISSTLRFVGREKTFSVSGQVVDKNHDPISQVAINFTDESGRTFTVLTDDEGAYTKSGLEGKVTITPVKENWQFTPPTVEVQSTNPSLVFIGTALLYTVSGKTVDAQGNPVPGVQVSFTGEDGITETVISDENGEFTKSGLTGEVTVRAFKGNWSFEPAGTRRRVVSPICCSGVRILRTPSKGRFGLATGHR